MGLSKFPKQNYEEFVIAANFATNMEDGELITFQTVVAEDSNGDDVSDEVLDQTTVGNDGAQMVTVLVRRGDEALSPYKLTFYCETNASPTHKWELDVEMKVKEL